MDNNQTQHLFMEADRGITVEKDGQRRCMGCMELYSTEYDLCPHCGYPINAEVENALHMYPGTVLNEKYVVGKVLGYGGFGVTYLAWDTVLQIKVAIKEYLPSEFSTRSAGQTRVTVFSGEKSKQFSDGLDKFVDEAKRLAMFRNEPGIVKIFDSFEENSTAYIAMEYLEGETLAEYLEREKTVSVDEAVQMLMPVIESLNKVHDEGIIHRDIAPDNIFLTTKGEVKLIDFGASRYATTSRSRSLTVIIKPGYSAEEQYRSRGDQGSHTDVYSIGAVLYRMVTGQTPPDAMERRAQYEKNRKDILVPISKITKGISKSQENSILNAMNVRIEDRTPDMISLAGELLSDEPVKRRKSGLRKIDPLTWPLWAKIGVPLAIVAVIVLSILLAFGIIGPKSTLRTDFNIPDGQTLVPDVVADELEDAQKRLEKYDLQWRIKDTKLSETIKSGLVLMHEPDAGNIAPIGTYIDITISAGLGTAFVEDFTGYTFEDAKKVLEDLGFVVEIKEKRNSDYGEGIVFDQSVKSSSAEKGTEITLYVSKGQKVDTSVEVSIPNVVGKTYDEARAILGDSNLTIVKSTKVVYDATKAVGEIVSQTPSSGTMGREGDRVTVTVNAGAKKVRVPNVTNITKEQAVKELETAGLVANVEYGKNQYYTVGTVYAQSIDTDNEVAPGTIITITVSEGYKVKVPNVKGMELSEAQSTLRQSGFASSIKEYKTSATVENGHVISQSVAAGSEVDADTVVYLTVSSGTTNDENATKYKFTIVAGDSGILSVHGNGNYVAGETFNITVVFKDGYFCDTVKLTGLDDAEEIDKELTEWGLCTSLIMKETIEFTMPANNITMTVTSKHESELSETTTVYTPTTDVVLTIYFDANGGSVSTNSKNVNYGTPISLPTPTRNYYAFSGWYTSPNGGSKVTSNTSIYESMTLYAHWTENSDSSWVLKENVPSNAKITYTKTQYRYQDKEYKKGQSSSSISGWTLYNTNTLWGEEKTSRSAVPSTSTRKVWTTTETETKYKTVYWYKRYTYKNPSNNLWYYSYGDTWAKAQGYSGRWEYKSSETQFAKNGTVDGVQKYKGNDGGIWYAADCNPKQGTEHTTYAVQTPYSSQYTLYHYQDAYYTYDFYRWGSWSSWSDSSVSKSDSRNVETREMCKYKTK